MSGIRLNRPANHYPRDKSNLYECVRWKLEYLRRKVYRKPFMFDYPYKKYIGMKNGIPWIRYVLNHVVIGEENPHYCKRVSMPSDDKTEAWWNYSGTLHCIHCKLMGNFNTFTRDYPHCLEIK